MKNLWIFGAAAVLSLAACSKNIDPADPGASGTKGDLYMTMTITPTGAVGTRATTATPNQGTEVGQDDENKIGSALIIFAKEATPGAGDYKVFATLKGGDISGTQSPYLATYKMDRNILLNDVKDTPGGVTYSLFVIANPTRDMETYYETAAASYATSPKDVQHTFALSEDADTYWSTTNGFLMSNAELGASATKTITADMVAIGTHTTETDPLVLGSVTVQRAMSRFDINTTKLSFSVENEKSPISGVSLTFDAVALVNMAKSANMFKVTAASKEALGNKTISFYPSREGQYKDYWVFSPDQGTGDGAYIYQLFGSLANADGKLTGTAKTLTDPGFEYTSLASLEGDRDTFTKPSDQTDEPLTGYKFWRYCMENTNPDDPQNQKNGNSTGVVFRAKMTFEHEEANFADGDNLYAYGNVVFGNAEDLRDYVVNEDEDSHTSDADVFRTVSNHYNDAVAAYQGSAGDKASWTPKEKSKEQLEDADFLSKLVAEGFTIYRPQAVTVGERPTTENVYYCYYFYWNRHNNNGLPTQMGIMEFATVRNNVYKLSVSSVLRLGHPADPDDDPDPEDPDDPDEEDNFYCQIECKVLDWEVRINEIEF